MSQHVTHVVLRIVKCDSALKVLSGSSLTHEVFHMLQIIIISIIRGRVSIQNYRVYSASQS